MANDAYSVVKGLRKIGVEAELVIQRPYHVSGLPQWEEGDVDLERLGDPYDPNWDALSWEMPDWCHVWDARKQWYPFSRRTKWLRLMLSLREYDLIIGHIPFAAKASIYSRIHRKPYTVYDAGWIRYLQHDLPANKEARRGYKNAAAILFTNVDTQHLFKENGYSNVVYTPFAIDTQLYSPASRSYDPPDPIFFQPTRQYWGEKGNDRIWYAFARYLKRKPKAKLRTVYWKQERLTSYKDNYRDAIKLVDELGIQDSITWLPFMNKKRLIEEYRNATAVFDQFVLEGLGTTGYEVMACEKPLVSAVVADHWLGHHRDGPPATYASSVEEIYNAMVALENPEYRIAQGKLGRKWVLENCDDVVVARHQAEVYKKILDDESRR